ncbi:MAG: hypothetical protein QGF00_19565 [Planctomycetota bacterium]|jgi:hypothetical protein|nr:hypothetical protein [Planctomycetota bacterium]MDP7251817.1 hypothetical protein [Planctomycetota bacterium]
MDIQKIGVKFFVEDSDAVVQKDLIPVFHSWIQEKSVDGHLLIDVHDYSHVPNGPGILLVAHEGNFCMDEEGGTGLIYTRKQPQEGDLPARVKGVVQTALAACRLLESAESLILKFKTDGFEVIANDRLAIENVDDSAAQLTAAVQSAAGADATVERKADCARERLALVVRGASV